LTLENEIKERNKRMNIIKIMLLINKLFLSDESL
jgi:hypothetical protein